jgi:hypothetical protein
MAEETQTAYATSMFSDPTNLALALTILVAILSDPQVVAVFPPWLMPKVTAFTAAVAVYLRTVKATNPVAVIAPGQVKPVEVKKLEKTQQGSEDIK